MTTSTVDPRVETECSDEKCEAPRIQPLVLKMSIDARDVHAQLDLIEARIRGLQKLMSESPE